jgi:hypothetical protein
LAYLIEGQAKGIGPLAGQSISMKEIDYETSTMTDVVLGPFLISYAEGDVFIQSKAS